VAKLFLPDNTVLVNFALIHRMDLLGELIKSQGCWCISVARECQNSASVDPKYSDMTQAATIFGTPLLPSQAVLVDTRTLRDSMASPGDPATKHLGEADAETEALVEHAEGTAARTCEACGLPGIPRKERANVGSSILTGQSS
jgi:hypothetical protein